MSKAYRHQFVLLVSVTVTCFVRSRHHLWLFICTTPHTYTWERSTKPSLTAVTIEMDLCSSETRLDKILSVGHLFLVKKTIYIYTMP